MRALAACVALCTLSTTSAAAPTGEPLAAPDDIDFTELSLEELMDIEVTIATRSAEPMKSVPAAVYVLTGDEIRRSGFTSVPDALRMVPGFYVSRWTTGSWDVTSRGFGNGVSLMNQAYLNQLLVMIDGVVVYSPQFAGVWWAVQDVMMDDIDRIEVVRGPGGALWGTNAVHGVVHIITKNGADTLGWHLHAQTAKDDRLVSGRYGAQIGEDAYMRVWARGVQYDTLANPAIDEDQRWQVGSFGTRFDWKQAGYDFTVWARGYAGEFENRGYDLDTFDPIHVQDDRKGAQFLANMRDPDSGARWQAWYTTDQQDLPTLGDIRVDVFDFEYDRSSQLGESHRLNWGVGYRHTYSYFFGDDPFWLAFDPERHNLDAVRAYALDNWRVGESDTTLTYGATIEYNELTGVEVQPTVRAAYTPDEPYMLWAAISRAVRTPSLEERADSFWGNDDFRSETLIAYEVGARWEPTSWMSSDLALYFNDYDDLHYLDPSLALYTNNSEGEAYGAELALDLQPVKQWKVRTSYTYHHGEYWVKDTGELLPTGEQSPKHAFSVRSYYDILDNLELDLGFYGVQGLGALLPEAEYLRLDGRLGWTFTEGVEAYVGFQGITDPLRSEYDEFDQHRRTAYLGVRISH